MRLMQRHRIMVGSAVLGIWRLQCSLPDMTKEKIDAFLQEPPFMAIYLRRAVMAAEQPSCADVMDRYPN